MQKVPTQMHVRDADNLLNTSVRVEKNRIREHFKFCTQNCFFELKKPVDLLNHFFFFVKIVYACRKGKKTRAPPTNQEKSTFLYVYSTMQQQINLKR